MSETRPPHDHAPMHPVPTARPIAPPAIEPPPHPMSLADSTPGEAWADLLKLGLVFLILFAIGAPLASIVESNEWFGDPRQANVAMTIFFAGVLLYTIHTILRRRKQTVASIGFTSNPLWLNGLLGLAALAGTWVVMYSTLAITAAFFPEQYAAILRNPDRIAETLPKLHPVAIFALAAGVGFYEEVICRGFLLTRLRKATGSSFAAVLISSAMFALPHAASQEVITVVPLFGAGVLWSCITLWRRSIIPAVIGHTLFDLISLLYLIYAQGVWE